MRIMDWRVFYNSLAILPVIGEPAPKPTVAQLDQFEAETGFRLPRGYREYILVFGPGRLFTDWDIAAPGCGAEFLWDLDKIHEIMRRREGWEGWLDLFPEAEHERIRRCRYFGRKYKDFFGWDPVEVSDPSAPEYAIYRITEDDQVVHVANSFRGFVEAAAQEILWCPGWDEARLGPRMSFEPAPREAEPTAAPDTGRT
jgi:hypothetical protein